MCAAVINDPRIIDAKVSALKLALVEESRRY
jgi:hypothetical protein